MKNILVLIDLSPRSAKIAQLALKLARQINANLLLCDVLNAPLNKVILFEDNEYWPFEDEYYPNAEALVNQLKQNQDNSPIGRTFIDCASISDFNTNKIKDLVVEKEICMMIVGVQHLTDLKASNADNYARQIIDHANCPVLVIPEHTRVKEIDRIAYLTDLRYCEIQVVNFLKAFNAYIFVTHISASGIPDMEDGYAQSLLSDAFAAQVGYNKLFLRNIKGENRKNDLETVVSTADIKVIALVNKKHQMLDRFIQTEPGKKRDYHNLPLLVIPYMNRYSW